MAEKTEQAARHPIGVVAERTGLSIHQLRAWERRYGAVDPDRTEGRRRLYSDADVERLRLLRRASERRRIARVAELTTRELAELVAADARERAAGAGEAAGAARPSGAGDRLEPLIEAATALDGGGLYALLMRAAAELPARDFVERLVVPLLERVGELWCDGSLGPAQEHLATHQVRRALSSLLSRLGTASSGPSFVVTTPAGELHELGALIAGIAAAEAGWRVVYLGPSLPAEDVAVVAEAAGARAVGLSLVGSDHLAARIEEVERLRRAVPDGTLVVAGGRAAAGERTAVEEAGAVVLADLDGLRAVLGTLGSSEPARQPA